jgi:hypothetical protein
LVEVVVALVISAILISAVSALLISGTNLFSHTANRDLDENTAASMLDFIKKHLRNADSISVVAPNDLQTALNGNHAVLYVGDANGVPTAQGYLWMKRAGDAPNSSVNLFGNEFYHGRKAALIYTVDRVDAGHPKAVTIKVVLFDGNKEIVRRTASIQLINSLISSSQANSPPLPADAGIAYYDPPTTPLILEVRKSASP